MSWGAPQSYQARSEYGNPAQYGSQAPPPQFGSQAPPPQFGSQAPPPQYGSQAPPPQYGSQAPPTQIGSQAPPPQYGSQAPPTQIGSQAPPAQYGSQAPPPQFGSQAPPPQYGSQSPPPQYRFQPPTQGQFQAGYGTVPPPNWSQPPGPAPGPPPGVSNELWQWFQTVDIDKSGQITAEELKQALLNGNWTPFNDETCRLMIGMFDRDKNGTIGIQEFAALWKYIQDWKACFDRFDTDRSGNINASELANAFRAFGYNLSMDFVRVCMRTYDKHQGGTIDFDNFIQCCVLLKSLTDQFRLKDTQQAGVIRIQYEEFLKMVLDTP